MLQHSSPLDTPTGRLARAGGWSLVLLLTLYLLPGTLQRGPWKNEDAMFFGVVWRALESGDWLHFHLSSSLQPESPLYFWLASATGSLLQSVLPAPAAIRFATTLFVALTFGALFLTARRLFDKPWAGMAPLTLAGCLGLLIAAHDTQPMTATMAAISVLLYGVSLSRPTAHFPAAPLPFSIFVLSVGVAGMLLSSGLRLLPTTLLVLLAGLIHAQRPRYALAMSVGLAFGVALFLGWWLSLDTLSPALAGAWRQEQLELLMPNPEGARQLWNNLSTLSWWAWPAWPLAAYTIWIHRQRLMSPALLSPVVLTCGLLLNLSLLGPSRQVGLATLLPSLALLSVPALMSLRRGAESLLDWFGRTVFGLLLLVVGLGWTAIIFGWPSRWAIKAARLAPGFEGSFELWALLFAALATFAWIWTIAVSRRSPQKSLYAWSGGLITFWAAIVALWLPWFDHQRSYQGVAKDIQKALGNTRECLRVANLSEAQFASFDYYLSNPMHRKAIDREACRTLLVQITGDEKLPMDRSWHLIWEGARPGDATEKFQLYSAK